MSSTYDLHPDMAGLVAAKQAVGRDLGASALRNAWDSYGQAMQRPYPEGMVVEDSVLHEAGGRGIPVRIHRPQGLVSPAPCVVYLHGGSFIKGSLDSGDAIAWGVADQVRAVAVTVDYRLAPEHPFPAGVEDCYAALACLASSAAGRFGIDPERIAVWGDSAGGGLAAAVCLMARDRGGPRIVAQALNYPMLTDDLSAPSYREHAESPGARTASLDEAWTLYLGERRPTRDPYAVPLQAADLSGLPPAHVHIAEFDPLADDGRAYAERLRTAGNAVVFRLAERMIHGFLRARFFGPGAAEEFAQPCRFLAAHLSHPSARS